MTERRSMSVRLRNQLVESFQAHRLQPGDRLPSEAEIALTFEVGRSTAREALKLLEQEGLVVVVRGRGRFLSSVSTLHVERPITRFESITAMLRALGYAFHTAVLSAEEAEPNLDQRRELGLHKGQRVVRLERLRYSEDNQPLVYEVDVVPRDLVAGPVKHLNWSGSLTELLGIQGHAPVSSAAHLHAVDLPADVCERYRLDGLGPWLLITELAITKSGQRILWSEAYHRGALFTFSVIRR